MLSKTIYSDEELYELAQQGILPSTLGIFNECDKAPPEITTEEGLFGNYHLN